MTALRKRYGAKPVFVRNPLRSQVLLLSSTDVAVVLNATPDPFSPASSENRAALSHFEPHGSLVSCGPERAPRRAFSDAALQSDHFVHSLVEAFADIAGEEGLALMGLAAAAGKLDWTLFSHAWFRLVRRVVLGNAAAGDCELTRMLERLRSRANWAFLVPKHKALRRKFHDRLAMHLARAELGSLASCIAEMRVSPQAHATDQIAQWLFAFDPAGMTALRALALLASDPEQLARARAEIGTGGGRSDLPFLRAATVETLRLYPTTPLILRQTTRPTTVHGDILLPKGTGVAIYAPFVHRDPERGDDADRFAPEFWLGKDPAGMPPLVPFSAGPASCPARHLVPMLASMVLAAILCDHSLELERPTWLRLGAPLKGTLNNYALRFHVNRSSPTLPQPRSPVSTAAACWRG